MIDGNKVLAVFCFITFKNKFLLMERYFPPYKGYFVPVGGKMKAHETPDAALQREVMEEIGILVDRPKFCGVLIESSPTSYNYCSFLYSIELPEFKTVTSDEGAMHWIEKDDVLSMKIPPIDQYIYPYIFEGKPFVLDAVYDGEMALQSVHCKLSSQKFL
ncbi:MAG: NUDIX domain-containing protein [Lewinellaceae bacterium]|nr:NUDIX domain-containing protein [Lewinellaceae bacterium]